MFATWSLHYNKTLDYFNKGDNGAGGIYAAAYLDSDTLLDVVELRNLYNGYDANDNIIITRLSTLGYSSFTTLHISEPSGEDYESYWYWGCDSLFFVDANNDETVELYARFQYQVLNCKFWPLCFEYTIFVNYLVDIWNNSSDIVAWLPYTDFNPLCLFHPDTLINVVINEVAGFSSNYHDNTNRGFQNSYISGYIDNSLIFSHVAPFEFDCAEDHVNQYSIFRPYWIDDILLTTPGYEFITVLDQRSDGWSYDGTTETHCSLGSKYLACYNLVSRDQMDTLWKTDITGQSIPGYIFFDADFPGQFFTIHNYRIYFHDADDGQAIDESPEIFGPGYQVIGYSPVADEGDPKLIICESGQIKLYDIAVTTSADDPAPTTLPDSFVLGDPYPNPFNPTLSIPVELNKKSRLRIEVFNISGQKVGQLVDRTIPAGKYEYIWDGSKAASGVYLVRAAVEGQTEIVKAVLLK